MKKLVLLLFLTVGFLTNAKAQEQTTGQITYKVQIKDAKGNTHTFVQKSEKEVVLPCCGKKDNPYHYKTDRYIPVFATIIYRDGHIRHDHWFYNMRPGETVGELIDDIIAIYWP